MSKAFVVEWDPVNYNGPIIGKIDYYGRYCYYDDPRRNECNFAFNWFGVLHKCSYLVNSAYEAKVLTRLLNRVSNFQIYCTVYDKINNKNNNLGTSLYNFKKEIETLGNEEDRAWWMYFYNRPESQDIRKDIPFDISEIDTKQPLKLGSCFFYEQYKMYDENGHPLYLAVAVERKNDGTEDADLFNYNVKFIGSGQPLPKQWQPVSLCYDGACYNQKSIKYKREHAAEYKKYANHIKEKITNPDYKKNFETYTYKEELEWEPSDCPVIIRGLSCPRAWRAWGVGKLECWGGRSCQFYKTSYRTIHHDGKTIYNRFLNVFGQEIAELVKNGKFGKQHWSMMPDFSDPEFIQKFNKYKVGSTLHFFDDEGYIRNRQMHLNGTLGHIKYWAQRPDFDVLRFVYCGNVHTISSLNTKTEQIEPEVTEDPAIFPTDLKTRLLWSNMGRIEFPTIYMKSPGTTRIINSDIGVAYDFVDEDAGIYYDYTETRVKYKKTKSKDELETTYKFPYPWKDLGYNLDYLMDDVQDMQQDGNLKWEPSKLFSKDVTDMEIEVMRANVDYNGIMVLNPKKMSPIKCDHYEIRESRYDSYFLVLSRDQKWQVSDGITCYLKNILLFNKAGQVSGVIHTDYVDEILPHIIATNQEKHM